jgi:hypothetical protein
MSRRWVRKRSLRFESLENRNLLASYATDSWESVVHDQTLYSMVSGWSDDPMETPSYGVQSGPSNGSLSLDGGSGMFEYTPNANFVGADSFQFSVNGEATGTVTIDVTNSLPVAFDSSESVIHDQTLSSFVSGYDMEDPVTYLLQAGPSQSASSLTFNASGSYEYTPAPGFVGADSFTFGVTDGIEIATGTVTVDVTNTAPAANDGSLDVMYHSLATGSLSAYDPDGDSLTYELIEGPSYAEHFQFNPDGSFEYTPIEYYDGDDHFTFRVTDGIATSGIFTMLLRVGPTAAYCNPIGAQLVGLVSATGDWYSYGSSAAIWKHEQVNVAVKPPKDPNSPFVRDTYSYVHATSETGNALWNFPESIFWEDSTPSRKVMFFQENAPIIESDETIGYEVRGIAHDMRRHLTDEWKVRANCYLPANYVEEDIMNAAANADIQSESYASLGIALYTSEGDKSPLSNAKNLVDPVEYTKTHLGHRKHQIDFTVRARAESVQELPGWELEKFRVVKGTEILAQDVARTEAFYAIGADVDQRIDELVAAHAIEGDTGQIFTQTPPEEE